MSEETEETPSIFPLEVGEITLTRYDGASYVDEDGRTYYSGAEEPSEADAQAAVANPVNPPEVRPVPDEVGPAQIRIAMRRHGLNPDEIDTAIEAIEDADKREEARYLWRYASTMRRDNWLVGQMASILDVTETQIDNVFREAHTI